MLHNRQKKIRAGSLNRTSTSTTTADSTTAKKTLIFKSISESPDFIFPETPKKRNSHIFYKFLTKSSLISFKTLKSTILMIFFVIKYED